MRNAMPEELNRYRRIHKVVLTPVAGEYDEDGELRGEEYLTQQQIALYFPWDASGIVRELDQLLRPKAEEAAR